MNVTSELISRYVDGAVSEAESEAVRQALAADPVVRAEFEELSGLEDLFGTGAGEPLPEEFLERLSGLKPIQPLERFVPVEYADGTPEAFRGERRDRPETRWSWGSWVAAAAVLMLTVFGVMKLTHRPEVTLHGFARYTLAPDGSIAETVRAGELTMQAGDTLRAAANERLAFTLADGSRIALQPGGAIEVGDPRDGELLAIHGGTILCSVVGADAPRQVRAGGYSIAVRDAHFGVRVEGADVRAAGAGAGGVVRVTITVSRGSIDVARAGERESIREYERVVLAPGSKAQRSHASADPVFHALMREYRAEAFEVVPGFYRSEPGTFVIGPQRWQRDGRASVLTVTDGNEAFASRYLILQVNVDRPTAFRITRIVPFSDAPGRAEAVTVATHSVPAGRRIVSVPLSAFAADDAVRADVQLPPSRSRLARIEVRPTAEGARLQLKTSLWAGRAPAPESQESASEEVR